jgi:hypothetical protein
MDGEEFFATSFSPVSRYYNSELILPHYSSVVQPTIAAVVAQMPAMVCAKPANARPRGLHGRLIIASSSGFALSA